MIAYELRAEYTGTVEQVLTVDDRGNAIDTVTVPAFTGGIINAGDRDLDVAAELKAGDGRIIVDEGTLDGNAAAIVLDGYPALKRAPSAESDRATFPRPAGEDLPAGTAAPTVAELRARADTLGLKVESGTKRDELAKGLEEQATRAAAGELLVSPSDERTVTITKDGSLAVASSNAGEVS